MIQFDDVKLTNFLVWLDNKIQYQQALAFNRLKVHLANQKVKQLLKGRSLPEEGKDNESNRNNNLTERDISKDYQSVNKSSFFKTRQSKKPLDSNYTSVTTSNYASIRLISKEQLKLQAATRETYVRKIFDHHMEEGNSDGFLESWMVRQQGQPILAQDYPYSQLAEKKISAYPEQALETVRKYKFLGFSKRTVKRVRGWFFTEKNPMKYQKSSLSRPLIHLPDHLQDIALEIFEELLMAGGDKSSQFPPVYHIYNIIQSIINGQEDIRQEALFQAIKQASSYKPSYIEVLCCLSATVKTSTRMHLHLLNYFMESGITDIEGGFQKHYAYCFSHTIKSKTNYTSDYQKPYTGNPSMFQLFCYANLKKVPITVAFPREKIFFVESITSVEEFIEQVVDFYNLDPDIQYLVYMGGYLLQSGRLLDQYARITQRKDQKAWAEYYHFKGLKVVIVLKNMMLMRQSNRCFNLMYNYFVEQHLRGCFRMHSKQMARIGGLILKAETNNQQAAWFSLQKLLPQRKFNQLSLEEDTQEVEQMRERFRKHIIKSCVTFSGTRYQARKEIMKQFQNFKGFLTHFFTCSISYMDGEEHEARVGLKWDKLLVVDLCSGRLSKIISYSDISDWGTSKSQICFRVDQIGQLHCTTPQVQTMASIFQCYLNYNLSKIQPS